MSAVSDQIWGWGAAALLVGGLVKIYIDGERPVAPTDDKDPFDTPELRASRADVEARMKKLGISTDPDTLDL